jgi:hypothetical protein
MSRDMNDPGRRDELHWANLALARRHVLDGAARVARQQALVDHLRRQGIDTTTAQALLDSMTDLLDVFRDHLEALSGERSAGQFHWIRERPDPLLDGR